MNYYNFRCHYCGDSKRNKSKKRAWFFEKDNQLLYNCFNCNRKTSFKEFLEEIDPVLYKEYKLELFKANRGFTVKEETHKTQSPKFGNDTFDMLLLDKLLDPVNTFPEHHEVVQYCKTRKIPVQKWKRLYYIDDVRKFGQLKDKYRDSIKTEESRLVLPCYNLEKKFVGLSCRAIHDNPLRYMTVIIRENEPMIFGINEVNFKRPIFIVEGAIDSLFLDNAIAVNGSAFNKVDQLQLPDDKVIVFDNQPHNKEICNLIHRQIEKGNNVVIWPDEIKEKDINEMVKNSINVKEIVYNNIFKNLSAKLRFNQWRKC